MWKVQPGICAKKGWKTQDEQKTKNKRMCFSSRSCENESRFDGWMEQRPLELSIRAENTFEERCIGAADVLEQKMCWSNKCFKKATLLEHR